MAALPDSSSYPPPFRRSLSLSAAASGGRSAPPAPPSQGPTADLPVINLQALDPGALAAACSDWGIFLLEGHGIPSSLLRQLHGEARRILSLPFEAKQERFSGPAATYFFGTPAVGLAVRNLNWVEGLHVPLGLPPPPPPDGDGAEESELSSFRAMAEEYGRHSARVVRALFEALPAGIGLDGEHGRPSYLCDSSAVLRACRYPRCAAAAGEHLGMDAHTDSSVFTTVSQDEVGGLQVRRGQTWLEVKPVAGALVVNVGDMLQAMSGDRMRSAEHRVRASGETARISICYFVFPHEDAAIASSGYRAFTYREFREKVVEDIRAVGFKVGLERFRSSGGAAPPGPPGR